MHARSHIDNCCNNFTNLKKLQQLHGWDTNDGHKTCKERKQTVVHWSTILKQCTCCICTHTIAITFSTRSRYLLMILPHRMVKSTTSYSAICKQRRCTRKDSSILYTTYVQCTTLNWEECVCTCILQELIGTMARVANQWVFLYTTGCQA